MRSFVIAFALGGTGCLSIVVTGNPTAAATSGGNGGNTGDQTGASTGATSPLECAPNAHYVGDVCLLDFCGPTSARSPCLLSDGGVGTCAAGNCLSTANDPSNCGGPGYICPSGAQCFDGRCWGPGGDPVESCDACPERTACSSPFCILQTCGPDDDDRAC